MTKQANSSSYNIRVVERAMQVLIALGEESPLGITELANRLGLHKSTVHRIMVTLASRDFVKEGPKKDGYHLGSKLIQLGGVAVSRLGLQQEAKPCLENLSKLTGYTTHLVVLANDCAIYLDKVESPNSIVNYSHIGKTLPLNATAAGKVLLAYLSEEEIGKVLANGLKSYTRNTIADPVILQQNLNGIKRAGYATDMEELEIGLRCVAAPVRDSSGTVVAAVSLSGVGVTMTEKTLPLLIKHVKETGQEISYRLGCEI